MVTGGRIAVLVGLALAAIAGPALAEDAAAPLIVAAAADDDALRDLGESLEALARRRGTAVLDLTPSTEPPPTAARRLANGIERYQDLDYDRAYKALDAGVEEAARTGAAGLSATELSDLHLYRALVLTQLGDSVRAWDDFVRAAVLDPTRRLDPVRFPPRAVETFQRAVDDARAAAGAGLRIEVDGACAATVDGRAANPASAIALVPGEHYVRVECPGRHPYGSRVLVHDRDQVLRPALTPRAAPDRAARVALARDRGATALLSIDVTGTGATRTATLTLVDTDDGRATMTSMVGPGPSFAADVIAAADRLIDERMSPVPLVPVVATPEPAPWYRKPWVWGLAGAALTAAVLLPLTLGDGDSDVGLGVRPGGALAP